MLIKNVVLILMCSITLSSYVNAQNLLLNEKPHNLKYCVKPSFIQSIGISDTNVDSVELYLVRGTELVGSKRISSVGDSRAIDVSNWLSGQSDSKLKAKLGDRLTVQFYRKEGVLKTEGGNSYDLISICID